MRNIHYFLLLLLFGLANGLKAQVAVDSMIGVYGRDFPQEKLHLHMDKPVYNAGESIWFKSYIFSGIYPSRYSTNFYIEMINPNTGVVIQRKMFPVSEGTSFGNLDIPADFKLPAVVIRAYTPWMLNFDEAFVYTRKVKILSPGIPLTTDTVVASSSIAFLPEGGNIVARLKNNIAFKSIDRYGDPVGSTGDIKDSKGNVVATFRSEHDGMGKFEWVPVDGESYTASWTDDNKKAYTSNLPAVQSIGAVLKLGLTEDSIPFILERSVNAPAHLQSFYLLAHFNQEVVYKAKVNMTGHFGVQGKIPLTNVPTGILTIMLFDNNWNNVAERIVFVNANEYRFDVQIAHQEKNLRKRSYNSFTIEVPDEISANMSVAVTDADASASENDEENILSRLLLTGELNGKIYKPYYYFTGNNEDIRSKLDLVMLTNGWRKYNWNELTKGKLPEIKVPNENYLSLKATISGVEPAQIPQQAQLNVFMVATDSSKDMFMIPYQNQQFLQEGMMFYDSVKLYYGFNKQHPVPKNAAVSFSNNTLKQPMTIPKDSSWFVPLPLDTALLNRNKFFADELARVMKNSKPSQVLEQVTVRAQRRQRIDELDEQYTHGLFSGSNGYQFDMEKAATSTIGMNVFQFLQGRVPGLQIFMQGVTDVSLLWRNQVPSLYLDEMLVQPDMLVNMPVSDIAYVKVMRPPFMGGSGGAGGAIAVYTRRGAPNDIEIPSNLLQTILYGYNTPKDFYAPDYTKKIPAHSVEDLRSTLYWNPLIITDEATKKVKVEFYNNDVTKEYRIIIEGITPDGKLARVEKIVGP